MAVVWCDPPTTHRVDPQAYWPLLQEVMAQPGEWAMIREFPSLASAHNAKRYLRQDRCVKPAGEWEFKAGRTTGYAGGIWAKWEPET